MPKNIFIIGSRGYKAQYGGWETLATKLVDYYNDEDTIFYVTQPTEDRSKNESIKKVNRHLNIIYLYSKNFGGATMFLHSIKAFDFCIDYVRAFNMESPIFYILGLKLFNKLKSNNKILNKLGIKTYVNPDGLEWQRNKWSAPVKKFFLKSEKLMLNYADYIICDAKGIKKYISNKYPKLKNKCSYIAYGADKINFTNIDETKILKNHELKSKSYCLMVGRCVPEDNYELVISEFMNSNINKDLVIITNFENNPYFKKLKDITHFESDKRIKFINGIYDKDKLATIRKNAYLYIHGHSVGGTNPSLIEAMSLTNVNVLYDVCFNKDIGKSSCLYFKKQGSLTKLLNDPIAINKQSKKMGQEAKKIVKENYTWPIIVNKYKGLFNV